MALAHHACRSVQVARAGVVAEALPLGEDLVDLRLGERLQGGEPRQPSLEARDHGLDPRLLQHDLRDPDAIGIVVPPPGQIAQSAVEPRQQRAREILDVRGHGTEDRRVA